MDKPDKRNAYHKTKHGFIFAMIYNQASHTYCDCANWRELCKVCGFEEGMRITFDIGVPQYDPITGPQHDKDIWVDLDIILVLSPSYFLSSRNTRKIVDETYYTTGSELT